MTEYRFTAGFIPLTDSLLLVAARPTSATAGGTSQPFAIAI